jgi:divalent metal cation (Fe/Co/Zn/Cd) transporter
LHLLVPGHTTVQAAHDLSHEVEEAVRKEMPELVITTHVEPIEDKTAWETDELVRLGEPAGPTGGGN